MSVVTEEQLIQAARDFLLVDGEDSFGVSRFFLDGRPVTCDEKAMIESLFKEGVFTFDEDEINSMNKVIPVRVRPGYPR